MIELDLRLHRIEKELLQAELKLEIALLEKEATSSLKEIILEIENIERKLRWFNSAIKRLRRVEAT
ncbi:MAG TPA: hypothetical protein VF610_03760 [Segetibacter sp.]